MAKRIGKYKVTKKESEVSLRDGGAIDGVLTRRTPETIIDCGLLYTQILDEPVRICESLPATVVVAPPIYVIP